MFFLYICWTGLWTFHALLHDLLREDLVLGSHVGFLHLSPEFALSVLVSRASYTIQNFNTNEIVLY